MRTARSLPRRTLFLFLALTLAASHAPRRGRNDLVVTFDEGRLAHMETTLDHLAARFKAEPALKKDFDAMVGDQKLSGDTPEAVSTSISKLHPQFAKAVTAEKWTPGDFYLTYVMFIATGTSEASGGNAKDAESKVVRRDMEFYEQHRVRCDAMLKKFEKVMGY